MHNGIGENVERVEIQEALDYCLANPDRLSVQDLLAKFPEYREELEPLLALSSRISSVEPPPVPADRRAAMKARLMAAAATQKASQSAAQQAGRVTAEESAVRTVTVKSSSEERNGFWSALRRPQLVAGAAAALLIALLWWGAAAALPDNPLYNVKIAFENFALNFAGNTTNKALAHVNLADARVSDIETMGKLDKLAVTSAAVGNFDEHINRATELWREAPAEDRDRIKTTISVTITRFEVTIASFDTSVAALPEPVKANLRWVFNRLGAIQDEMGELPTIEIPKSLTITPTRTPLVVLPTSEPSPSPTQDPQFSSPTAQSTEVGGGTNPALLALERATATIIPQLPTSTPVVASTAIVVKMTTATRVRPTNTQRATRTPRPATATRVVRTSTPTRHPTGRPTRTHSVVPSPTPSVQLTSTPTDTSVPTIPPTTETPRPEQTEPVGEVVCPLTANQVEAGCVADGGAEWSLIIANGGNEPLDVMWTAELQVRGEGDGNQVVDVANGRESFGPGQETLSGRFSYNLPPGADNVRVVVTIDSGTECHLVKTSPRFGPCSEPEPEPQVETTKTPRNPRLIFPIP